MQTLLFNAPVGDVKADGQAPGRTTWEMAVREAAVCTSLLHRNVVSALRRDAIYDKEDEGRLGMGIRHPLENARVSCCEDHASMSAFRPLQVTTYKYDIKPMRTHHEEGQQLDVSQGFLPMHMLPTPTMAPSQLLNDNYDSACYRWQKRVRSLPTSCT